MRPAGREHDDNGRPARVKKSHLDVRESALSGRAFSPGALEIFFLPATGVGDRGVVVVMGFEPTALTFGCQPETRPTKSRQLSVDFRVYKFI